MQCACVYVFVSVRRIPKYTHSCSLSSHWTTQRVVYQQKDRRWQIVLFLHLPRKNHKSLCTHHNSLPNHHHNNNPLPQLPPSRVFSPPFSPSPLPLLSPTLNPPMFPCPRISKKRAEASSVTLPWMRWLWAVCSLSFLSLPRLFSFSLPIAIWLHFSCSNRFPSVHSNPHITTLTITSHTHHQHI